jgi:two-component system, OmpR family, response regulator ChvI
VVLEGNGFKVDTFVDPTLALENFKSSRYDLLILDIKMPVMNEWLSIMCTNEKNRY